MAIEHVWVHEDIFLPVDWENDYKVQTLRYLFFSDTKNEYDV